ncbi:MAG: hypothetical protein AAFN92_22710, partial [Bacteroidota bacterium]
IYRTDGTPAGTREVTPLHAGDRVGHISEKRVVDGDLVVKSEIYWRIVAPTVDTLVPLEEWMANAFRPSAKIGGWFTFSAPDSLPKIISSVGLLPAPAVFDSTEIIAPGEALGAEFAYLSTANTVPTDWWLTTVDPATGVTRRDTLLRRANFGLRSTDAPLVKVAGALYFHGPGNGDSTAIYRYDRQSGLTRSLTLPPGRFTLGTRGVGGQTGLIAVNTNGTDEWYLIDQVNGTATHFGAAGSPLLGTASLPQRIVILTKEELAGTIGNDDLRRDQFPLLEIDTTTGEELRNLTMTASGELLFVKSSPNAYVTELWRTDGTRAGTVLLREFADFRSLTEAGAPLPESNG